MNYYMMTLCDMCAKTSLFHCVVVGASKKKSCDICKKRKVVFLYRVSKGDPINKEIGED